jgi:hypothetical protein
MDGGGGGAEMMGADRELEIAIELSRLFVLGEFE